MKIAGKALRDPIESVYAQTSSREESAYEQTSSQEEPAYARTFPQEITGDALASAREQNAGGNDPTLPFEQGAPYTGNASEENVVVETYEDFLNKNKEKGFLKVQAFSAQQALPAEGISIKVSKNFSDTNKTFFEGTTDSSGIIDDIELPAPNISLSEKPGNVLPYAYYDFTVNPGKYNAETADTVQIFPGIKSIQPVRIVPRP